MKWNSSIIQIVQIVIYNVILALVIYMVYRRHNENFYIHAHGDPFYYPQSMINYRTIYDDMYNTPYRSSYYTDPYTRLGYRFNYSPLVADSCNVEKCKNSCNTLYPMCDSACANVGNPGCVNYCNYNLKTTCEKVCDRYCLL